MAADRIEPRPWIRSSWFTWSWMIILALVVVQSVNYHWRLFPTTASGYFSRGRTDYIEGDYESAIGNLTKAIEGNPSDAESYIWRGEAFAKLRELDKAGVDIAKALALRPTYAKAHAALADYNVAIWDRDAAIEEFGVALRTDPTYARCYLERAQLYYDAGRWDEAVADLRAGATLLPDEKAATAYLLLWLARARSGDALGATAELTTILKTRRLDVRRLWAGAQLLSNQTSEPAYLATMTAARTGEQDELEAESFFVAGGKRLAFGDRAGGLALMRNVVRTGTDYSYAYDRARAELETSLLGFHPVMRTDRHALVIAAVTPGSAAEAAGIRPGSTLAAIDDRPADQDVFVELLAKAEPGLTVQLQIVEAGGSRRTLALPITLGTSAPTR